MDKLEELQRMIDECNDIVFFGGAGVSTESGIKDFRSNDGIYKENPEYMLSHMCFHNEPDNFFDFYKRKMNCLDAEPNVTHKYLKKLEDSGKLKAIITQNIDGLHNKAGNKTVYEIHGTIYKNHCIRCGKEYTAKVVFESEDIPTCSCGGIIKPDVVLYGEGLPEDIFDASRKAIYNADMLIVAGTSLVVYPANSLINVFRGKYLVIINYDKTDYDYKANLVINDRLKNVFSKLK